MMIKKMFIIVLLFCSLMCVSSNGVKASPDTDYTPVDEESSENNTEEEYSYEELTKCEKDDLGQWGEECRKISDEVYQYNRSVIYQWIRNSYDNVEVTEKEKIMKTEQLTSYYRFYVTGTSVVETYKFLDLEGADKVVEVGYVSAAMLNKLLSMIGFIFIAITLSFASLVHENTITNLFLDLFTYINETIFDFTNPSSFGWLFLGIIMLLILLYKIIDNMKGGSISISIIGRTALKIFVTGIIITYSFTEITPGLISLRNTIHNDVISYVSGGNTSEKSMNQKSMLFDMLSVNPFLIKYFGIEDYDSLLEDTKTKINEQIEDSTITADSLVEIYGSKAIGGDDTIDFDFITDSRLIGVATNNLNYLYYEYSEEDKKLFDDKPEGGNLDFTYNNNVIPGSEVSPYWELMGFELIMLVHTVLLSCVVLIIVMVGQLTTIVEIGVYCFIFVLFAKFMWVEGKNQVAKNIRARVSFFTICLVLAVVYELFIIGLNALTVKAIKEGFVVLLISDIILVILLVMLWKFKVVILKNLIRRVIPAFFKGDSIIKRVQDAGGVKNIAKANVEKIKTNLSDSTKNQNDLIKDLKKVDPNKALLYDSYLSGNNLDRKQKKKLRRELRDEVKANHTVELSNVNDIEKLETLTKNVFKQDSSFILDNSKTMDKTSKSNYLKSKISEKTKRKIFYDSEFTDSSASTSEFPNNSKFSVEQKVNEKHIESQAENKSPVKLQQVVAEKNIVISEKTDKPKIATDYETALSKKNTLSKETNRESLQLSSKENIVGSNKKNERNVSDISKHDANVSNGHEQKKAKIINDMKETIEYGLNAKNQEKFEYAKSISKSGTKKSAITEHANESDLFETKSEDKTNKQLDEINKVKHVEQDNQSKQYNNSKQIKQTKNVSPTKEKGISKKIKSSGAVNEKQKKIKNNVLGESKVEKDS